MVIAPAGQGGLSLPNRDYYTKTDEKSVKLRADFVQHVTNMFQLLGDAPEQAAKNAQTILAIETRLAENSRGSGQRRRLSQNSPAPVKLRDFSTQYNIMGAAELAKLTPNFSWGDYFAGLGLPKTLS